MDDRARQRILSNSQKKLNKKRLRLEELKRRLQQATSSASQASFKGKITRCKLDIESLEARIKRLDKD